MAQNLSEKIKALESKIKLLEDENEQLAEKNEKLARAKEAFRESEARYRTLFEQANDAIFLESDQDEIIDVNRRACELLGYTRRELLEMAVSDLQAPEVRGQAGRVIKQELERYGAVPFETVDLHRDGTRIPVEVSTSRIEGQAGDLVLSVVRDITERKQAEKALRRERDLVSRIMETSPVGIVMVNRAGAVTFANPQAEQVLGLTRAEIGQRVYNDPAWHITDFDGNPFPDEALPFQQVMKTGQPVYDLRHAIEWPTGRRVLLSINAAPIFDEADHLDGIVATIQNITMQVRAEQALRESEERFRNIVQASPMGMHLYELQPDGRLLFIGANPAADKILGVDNSDFIGLTIEQAFPPLAETEVPTRYRRAAAEGMPWETEQFDYEYGQIAGAFQVHAFQTSPGKIAVLFLDITERKQAEAALRQSEERFRRIFEQGPLGMGILSPDDYFIRANSRLCQMVGYTEEELTGLSYLDITHPDDVETSRELGRQLLSGEVPYIQTEKRYLTKAGDMLWIRLTATFIRDDQGQPLYKLTMIEDITGRKQAEDELRRLKEFNESIVQTMAEGIAVEDRAGNFIFANPAAATLLGYTIEDLVGRHWTEIVPPDQQPIAHAANRRRAEGQVDQYEQELVRRDGRRITVLVSGSPRFEANRFAGTIAVFADITKRARAERLLQALNQAALAMVRAVTVEEVFAAAAEELEPLGFSCTVSRLDQSQNRLLPIYLSYEPKVVRAAERLLGLERQDFFIPVDTAEVYRQVVREKQTILVENVEETLRQLLPDPLKRFAGRTVRILQVPQSIFAPLIIEEEVLGVFSVQSDDLSEDDLPGITVFAHQVAAAWRKVSLLQDLEESLAELERTQDQLLQAQKMEAIGQLAGGIAHDFNNLLTAINGFAGLMQLNLSSDDPLWEMTEKILDSGQRAADLIRQLLAFSRKQIIEPKVLILNDVVTHMEKMLQRLIGEDVQLETGLSSELWPVKVDPTQMGQVLVNLVVNARDAMPTGGRLTIETANVVLDEDYVTGHLGARPGDYVRLAVSETGHGIEQ